MTDEPEKKFDRWQKLKEVFTEAVELAPESRAAYLSGLRVNEKTLAAELADLIESEKESENFLAEPFAVNFDSSALQTHIGARIGNYEIVREIGRGGMGAVFEATRQDGEFERRVAVKLTDNGFFSDESRRRFNNERQILAGLEHPNIVRLYDGGILPNRTPYFVMEYVEGVSLNYFCRENEIDLDGKLKIFLQVCAAVAYAHQKLIVHRDLKPSNILVNKTGQVKLLDFGIAKTLSGEIQTRTAHAPHTPAYASPEQIKGERSSTLSDVYSLGVILYELLTGKTPAQIYRTSELGLPQAICEIEPKFPSAEIKIEKNDSKSAFQNSKILKGDLDNIVLKSLRKEKELRYVSVERFAGDIKNYLNGLPVEAHPQSFVYRARKFINRNRLTVAPAAAAILLIAAGVVAAVFQTLQARRQERIAEQRFDQVRKIAESLIFDYEQEIAKLPGSTKLRERLVVDAVGYLDAISREETDNPELLKETALAYRKIGDVQGKPYQGNLGKLDEALINYRKSISLLEKAVNINHSDLSLEDELAVSYNSLAYGEMESGKKKQSVSDLNKAVEICEALDRIDDNNLERKITFDRLQVALGDMRENTLTSDNYEMALEGLKELFAVHPENRQIALYLGIVNQRMGSVSRWRGEAEEKKNDFPAAKKFYSQAVEYAKQTLAYEKLAASLRTESDNDREFLDSYTNLAASLFADGQIDEAVKNEEIAEKLVKKIQSEDKNNRTAKLDELAVDKVKLKILLSRRKFDAALETIDASLKIAKTAYQNDLQNVEAINWVGYFLLEAINLSKKQNKNSEAQIYQKIYDDYSKICKERFGREWNGDFGV